MEIRRFEEEIGVHLPEGDYSTVGGMLISLAEKIPSAGDTFSVPSATLMVTRASDRAVLEVRVVLVTEQEGEVAEKSPGMDRKEGKK
jgi:CBS domain containing-hemolysin-like protein